jgi:hypothetical protein
VVLTILTPTCAGIDATLTRPLVALDQVTPYRSSPKPRDDEIVRRRTPPDDLFLAIALLVIGGIRVAIAIAEHQAFEAEATIGLFMIAMASGLFVRLLLRRS